MFWSSTGDKQMTQIDQISTSTFLNTKELDLINRGFAHMVDNGYSKLDGANDILRSLAVRIECRRRELNWVTKQQFPHLVAEHLMQIGCEEALLRNLAARSGV
jgi:hypothetical protein